MSADNPIHPLPDEPRDVLQERARGLDAGPVSGASAAVPPTASTQAAPGTPVAEATHATNAWSDQDAGAEGLNPIPPPATAQSSDDLLGDDFADLDVVSFGEAAINQTVVDPAALTADHPATGPYTGLPLDGLTLQDPEILAMDRPRSTLAEWTITILLLLFLTTTLVQAYVIPTGSMEDTLLIGDHLLVDKLAFAPPGPVSKYLIPYTEVKRGDIIVFRYPVDISQTFVKRCIGVPGDRIRIVNKEIYLNGVRVDEPYTYHKDDYIDSYRDNFPGDPNTHVEDGAYDMLTNHVHGGEIVVPAGHYFALGDNRDRSLDSRYWGFVPRENIIGKPLIVYWSYDAPTDQLSSSYISWQHIRDLGTNFFSKTRWERTFRLIHGYPLGMPTSEPKQVKPPLEKLVAVPTVQN